MLASASFKRFLLLLSLGTVFTFLACSGNELSADNYSRVCQTNNECVAVIIGNVCNCSCEYAAINLEGQKQYISDRDAVQCSDAKSCQPCPAQAVVCENRLCRIQQ